MADNLMDATDSRFDDHTAPTSTAEQSEEETYSDQENALRDRDESAWFKRHPYGNFRKDTKPWDEWCPRWLGQQKLWFFRQWHHASNLPPNLLHELQDHMLTVIPTRVLTRPRTAQIVAIGPNNTRFGPPMVGNSC